MKKQKTKTDDINALLKKLYEEIRSRDAELLRIRTVQSAAAHSIDNMGIEAGLGAGARPFEVEEYVRSLRLKLKEAQSDCRSALNTYEL